MAKSEEDSVNIVVRQAEPQDAEAIVTFMDRVAREPGALTFGVGEPPAKDASEEMARMKQRDAGGGMTFLAVLQRSKKKGGHKVVGHLALCRGDQAQTRNRAELTILVEPEHLNQDVERQLMSRAIAAVEQDQTIEVLTCRVRSDRAWAIGLCARFGLDATGTDREFFEIGSMPGSGPGNAPGTTVDVAVDATIMSRELHRTAPKQGKAVFYLSDILDAIDSANDQMVWYACRETGELDFWMDADYVGWSDVDEPFDPETAEGTWLALPGRREVDDWGSMLEFANRQDGGLRNRLLDIIHRRGAYRKFKDECARHDLLSDYYAFRDRRRRRVAIDWLERNGLAWTEGRRPRSEDWAED
jgi:hypothetical protein